MSNQEIGNTAKAKYDQIWLYYFNDSMLAQGLISEVEHQKMNARIVNRKGRRTPTLRH